MTKKTAKLLKPLLRMVFKAHEVLALTMLKLTDQLELSKEEEEQLQKVVKTAKTFLLALYKIKIMVDNA